MHFLTIPCFISEITDCKDLVQSVCGVLPITQDNISLIIDLVSSLYYTCVFIVVQS